MSWYAKHSENVIDYLRRFYASKRNARKEFADTVEQYLLPEYRVLHAGCADDESLGISGRCREVVGVDISESILTNNDLDRAIVSDIGSVDLPPAYFDLIVCRGLIEHLKDPSTCFRTFCGLLKNGGTVIMLTPNILHYGPLVTKLTPQGFHVWYVKNVLKVSPEAAFPAYYHANRPRKIRALMKKAGFETKQISMIDMPPYYLSFSYTTAFVGIGYERLVSRFNMLSGLRFWILGVFRKIEH